MLFLALDGMVEKCMLVTGTIYLNLPYILIYEYASSQVKRMKDSEIFKNKEQLLAKLLCSGLG